MNLDILGAFTNGLQALNKIIAVKPDYALLDMQMPGMCGIDILEEIRKKKLNTKVIIYTMFSDLTVFEQAKILEVNGYILKEFATEELEQCIKSLESGNNWYSPNLEKILKKSSGFSPEHYCKLSSLERSIVKSIGNKKTNQEIADEVYLSQKSIEYHRKQIVEKLELPNKKNSLLIWAVEHKGFFPLMDE